MTAQESPESARSGLWNEEFGMNTETAQPHSLSVKASWASLGLVLGCGGVFFMFAAVDGAAPFAHSPQGILTGFLPRMLLVLLWAGEALAVVAGAGGLVLIRRPDIASKAVGGIVVRSLCGIVIGLIGVLVLWLYVGHRVIGF